MAGDQQSENPGLVLLPPWSPIIADSAHEAYGLGCSGCDDGVSVDRLDGCRQIGVSATLLCRCERVIPQHTPRQDLGDTHVSLNYEHASGKF